MIRPVPSVAAMASYALADLGDANAVSLAQNESAFPTSPAALEAGQAALARSPLYPDPDWQDLRMAIASVHGLATDSILCGAGSMELIGCLIRGFAGAGDEVVGSQYGYLFVATACQQAGARYVQALEPELTVSVDELLNAVTPATRIVFLCNPGNPTGTRILNSDILRLRASLPEAVLLVIDQAYGEFDDQDHRVLFQLVDHGNTLITRTFSKAYGLAAARVGWGCFPSLVADEVRKLLNPNNVTHFSQDMAAAAMRDQSHMLNVVHQTAQIRSRFVERLRGAGLSVPRSHTNFVLIKFAGAAAAAHANDALRNSGYLLRGMAGYGLPECLRATIGRADVMDKVAEILIKQQDETHDS
ncbi:MAG: histidinol-phosphate transaminase [Paracoccaceae bacterium]|nr:histidinol-phosphate transaminase [Paracoccaceae bacterium]